MTFSLWIHLLFLILLPIRDDGTVLDTLGIK
jgi:hypothetical protein